MHNVIGMPLNRAVAALKRPGAKVHVTRARYGQYNVVLRATGFDIDGTYWAGIADRAAGRRARHPERRVSPDAASTRSASSTSSHSRRSSGRRRSNPVSCSTRRRR